MLNHHSIMPSIAVALVSVANADGPEALAPSSPWNVDYAESECRLSRTFGAGAETFIFRISRSASLKAVEYTVAGKSLKIRDWNYSVLLRLGPGGTSYKLPILWYRLPSGEAAVRMLAESGLNPEETASTRTLSMDFDNSEPLQLAVGNLGKPLAALESCYDDLLKSWNIDPAGIRGLKTAARPVDIHAWHVFEDGWARDVPKDKKSMIVRLDVNETGRATACKGLVSSGSPEVDAKVCALTVRNARFVPATSASGDKVGAPYVLQIQIRE
jgi:TonB family protein